MEPTIYSSTEITPSIILPAKVDIIWNITKICSWDCAVCCVDADHVSKKNGSITMKTDSLQNAHNIPFNADEGSIFDQTLRWKQREGLELTLEQKLQVLE